MKYIGLYSSIICLIVGFVTGSNWSEGEVKEVSSVAYITEYKESKKEKISYERAIGYLYSPLIIKHELKNNTIKIHAYDKFKTRRKEIRFKCASTDNWNLYFAVGAIGVVAGIAGTMYLLKR